MKRNALQLLATFPVLLAMLTLSALARAAQQDKPEPPKIIRKSGGVLQDSATKRVEPAYPPLAKTARISGVVVVEVTVDEEGKVISAHAVSGHPLLKDATVNAARAWMFTPTTLQGTPVKVIGTITFNFSLDLTEEIEQIKQKIAEKPNNSALYDQLGNLYVESGQSEGALGAYRQALVLEPNDFDAWMGIGKVEKHLGHSEAAIEAYKQAAQTPVPDNPQFEAFALMSLAEIYFEQQRYQEVVEAYKRALVYYSNFDPTDYMRLATAYLKLGDRESAMEQYRKLKEMGSSLAEQLLKQIKDRQ
jgi:TonB family C-terminal domain